MTGHDEAVKYFEDIYYKMFGCAIARIHDVNVALGLEEEEE